MEPCILPASIMADPDISAVDMGRIGMIGLVVEMTDLGSRFGRARRCCAWLGWAWFCPSRFSRARFSGAWFSGAWRRTAKRRRTVLWWPGRDETSTSWFPAAPAFLREDKRGRQRTQNRDSHGDFFHFNSSCLFRQLARRDRYVEQSWPALFGAKVAPSVA